METADAVAVVVAVVDAAIVVAAAAVLSLRVVVACDDDSILMIRWRRPRGARGRVIHMGTNPPRSAK